jgi:hypothetical protein
MLTLHTAFYILLFNVFIRWLELISTECSCLQGSAAARVQCVLRWMDSSNGKAKLSATARGSNVLAPFTSARAASS